MTDVILAVGIPLLIVVGFVVSARWWMPRMSRSSSRAGGLPVWLPWVWALLSAVELISGFVGLALGRDEASTYLSLVLGVLWGLLAIVAARNLRRRERGPTSPE